jgi:hypothetical protein
MKPTTTLPLHLADLMLDLEIYVRDYCAPGLPPDAASEASTARYHLSALQTCLERLEGCAPGDQPSL